MGMSQSCDQFKILGAQIISLERATVVKFYMYVGHTKLIPWDNNSTP